MVHLEIRGSAVFVYSFSSISTENNFFMMNDTFELHSFE